MTVFFTSDTHFGDTRILRTAKRPFKTIEAHDEALIAGWRETVGADDEVWHLGDFAPGYDVARVSAILARLPGRKHLVMGNNDDRATRNHRLWESVQAYAEMTVDGVNCVLCHYAFRTWYRMGKGSLDLHGHSHGKLKPLTRQFDVGVDSWCYKPVTVEALMASRRRRLKDLMAKTGLAKNGSAKSAASKNPDFKSAASKKRVEIENYGP